MKEAPDTGYAWVVAAAACLINFISAGLGRLSGILYVAFIDNFQVTRKEATKPFSIRSSTRNLLGPVVGILGQQYGVRAVTLTGAMIVIISGASCFFAPDMTWITIIWGGISGSGMSLMTMLPQVAIGQYFDKYRTTATGMAFSGGCVGAFIFPVLLEYSLHNYGVEGTFLIMAGIIMNVIPAAMILRRPVWMKSLPAPRKVKDDVTRSAFTNEGYRRSIHNDSCSLDEIKPNCRPIENMSEHEGNSKERERERNSCLIIDVNKLKETSLNEGEQRKSCTRNTLGKDQNNIARMVSVVPKSRACGELLNHLKTAIKLYTSPLFLLICLCRAIHFVSFMPFVTVIVDYVMDKGLLEEDGKYIIAALALGDLLGRLCLGWITDRGFLSLPKYMLIVMILQGATAASLPSLHGMVPLLIIVALFGMLQGSLFIRHPVLVSKYMGKNEQSIAIGCMNFLSGLLGFALPSFIGYFRDSLGSYDHMFHITGAMGASIGLLWVLEPYLAKFSRQEASS